MLFKEEKADKNWNAEISICENVITARVHDVNTNGLTDKYCYYLYDINNAVIEKSKWVSDISYNFEIEQEGAYFVKVFKQSILSRTSVLTQYVDYYNEHTRADFEEFCREDRSCHSIENIKADYFYKMKYPYKDFAVIVSETDSTAKEKFLDSYHFCEEKIALADFSLSVLAENTDCFKEKNILFSGLGKCGKKLIDGEEDLEFGSEISDENIGNFTYLKKSSKVIEIGNDYFGTGKLYYFMKEDISVISNNYHLLLLILKDIGITLKPNIELIAALLCKSGQAFQQSISREREMSGVYMLPADQYFEISEEGVLIKSKSISQVFTSEECEGSYEKLLEEGKKEIIENTEVVLADTRYGKVIVDLTGGLDSRIIYGAVSNLSDYKDKVVIHAAGLNASIDQENSDLAIAVRLNCFEDYDYNTIHENFLWRDIDIVENEMVSQSVLSGYYYAHSAEKMAIIRRNAEPAFELNGFYGEICCRPYYTRKLLQNKVKYEDIDILVSAIANRLRVLSGGTYNELKKKIKEELYRLPGNSLLEKWENHYLFYRNGLHCNTIWEYEKRTPQWGPLQSKALFQYKHLTYGKIEGAQEQLEIIHQMDPRLNTVRFADAQDEIERKSYLGIKSDENLIDCSAEQFEKQKQKCANQRREKTLNASNEGEGGQNYKDIKAKSEHYDEKIKEKTTDVLYKLMGYDHGIFKNVFGLAVFKALKEGTLSLNEQKIMYQKLISAYVQIKIFEL